MVPRLPNQPLKKAGAVLIAEMCENDPPNTSMPPQPALALGNWMAASWYTLFG